MTEKPIEKAKVYFLACCFPPIGRGNALTNACVANHLAEDFDVEVVCMEPEAGYLLSCQEDPSLAAGLNPLLKVSRIRSGWGGKLHEILYAFGLLPCYYLHWTWRVWQRYREIFARPGIVFAVYPVFSSLALAWLVHRRFGYPLLVDFRDDFSGVMARGRHRLWRPFFKRFEAFFMRQADHVTVTTEALKNDLTARHGLDPDAVSVVYNIVPPYHAERVDPTAAAYSTDSIEIVYAGAMSRIQSPQVLLHAYNQLQEQHEPVAKAMQIKLYGPESPYFRLKIKPQLKGTAQFLGFLPHAELVRQLAVADIGFLCLASANYAYATPTKLFEYIELGLPVLAVLPPGAARDLIERYELGLVVGLNDLDGLARALVQMGDAAVRAHYKVNVLAARPLFRPATQIGKWRDALNRISGGTRQIPALAEVMELTEEVAGQR